MKSKAFWITAAVILFLSWFGVLQPLIDMFVTVDSATNTANAAATSLPSSSSGISVISLGLVVLFVLTLIGTIRRIVLRVLHLDRPTDMT